MLFFNLFHAVEWKIDPALISFNTRPHAPYSQPCYLYDKPHLLFPPLYLFNSTSQATSHSPSVKILPFPLLSLPQGPSSPGPAQCKLLPTVACPPCALAVSFPGRLRWQGEATRAVCHGVILGAETVQLIRWHRLACAGAGRAGIWRGFTTCVCVNECVRVCIWRGATRG